MIELTSPQNLSEEKLDLAVYNSVRFLDDITSMESELGVIYSEAARVLRTAISELTDDAPSESEALAQDITQP